MWLDETHPRAVQEMDKTRHRKLGTRLTPYKSKFSSSIAADFPVSTWAESAVAEPTWEASAIADAHADAGAGASASARAGTGKRKR